MCGRIYPDSDRHAVGADDNGIPYRPPHGMPFFSALSHHDAPFAFIPDMALRMSPPYTDTYSP